MTYAAMSDPLSLVAAVAMGIVIYLIGFNQGWRRGRRAGELDGVAWATKRLQEETHQCQKN